VGKGAYTLDVREVCMVCSYLYEAQLNLTPSRCIVDHDYRWCKYLLFLLSDAAWAFGVILHAIKASGKGYVLSYGQVLAIFTTFPPLMEAARCVSNTPRTNFLPGWRSSNKLKYLFTAVQPHPPDQENHLPFNVTSYPQKPIPGGLRDLMSKRARLTHRSLLSSESGSATRQEADSEGT